MRTLFSVICCLFVAAPPVTAGPPNPTASDFSGNTAGGTNALVNNTTGEENTAFGFNALFSNSEGNNNTASGAYALRSPRPPRSVSPSNATA
jgi:hypothetical protein